MSLNSHSLFGSANSHSSVELDSLTSEDSIEEHIEEHIEENLYPFISDIDIQLDEKVSNYSYDSRKVDLDTITIETTDGEEQNNPRIVDKLQRLARDTKKDNPYIELDERRVKIHNAINSKQITETLIAKEDNQKSVIQRQLEENEKRFEELLKIGQDIITNVKVASEKREQHRRVIAPQEMMELVATVENESQMILSSFDQIASNWVSIKESTEPIEIYEKLNEQKKRLTEVMKNKDALVIKCQRQAQKLHDQFFVAQKHRADDIAHLVQRINAQVDLVKESYKEHIDLIQSVMEDERKKIAWAENWKNPDQSVVENSNRKINSVREYEIYLSEVLERFRLDQEQITRNIHMRLQKETEELEWELRNTKVHILKNSELMDYNYQILQKRYEEDTLLNILQKKRMSTIQNRNIYLKQEIIKTQTNIENKKKKMSAKINTMRASVDKLEKKTELMKIKNIQKFYGVWEMSFTEMKELLTDILNVDKLLYKYQLDIPWEKPDIDLEDTNKSPKKALAKTKLTARNINSSSELSPEEKNNLLNILIQFSDRSGFLIESRIVDILKPYSLNEKCLVRISHIFDALGIKNIKTVKCLTKYFKPYSFCPNCTKGPSSNAFEDLFSVDKFKAAKVPTELNPNCSNHFLVMEPLFVLTALNRFTKALRKSRKFSQETALNEERFSESANIITIANDDIKEFWLKYLNCFSKEKENLWKGLNHGLYHYLNVLKERKKLYSECVQIRKQNAELKYLLANFDI